jgi:DNA recombination protein RmuC
VVVDSKVNLVAWAEANDADSGEAYSDAMIRHAAAMRLHMRELAEKNYPRVIGESALDLTVMFVPIEGAMAAALSLNGDLQSEAFKKRVVFASPNTLMALLTVVERLWTRDKLQRQVGAIGEDAGKVLDAVTSFLDDFDTLEKRLAAATDAFGTAKRRLRDSDQSVVARTRRLVEQGAKGKKVLREELVPAVSSQALPLPLVLDEPSRQD